VSAAESHAGESLVEPLTRREREVLSLLAQGYSAPEIAQKLTLATSSVKSHIQHLYGKLGVNGKREAVARARELGLLQPTSGGPAGVATPKIGRTPAPTHNLPEQVTRFFGRETEIAQVKQLLVEQRLVTLTGAGGVGKSRLALHVADEVVDRFPDGLRLVELAPLSDPALVTQKVAVALGLRDEPGQFMLDVVTIFLRERQMLLVLDNCEHLLDACAKLADALLRACPMLRLLATSREPLGIAGEAGVPIPSLPFPDSNQALSLEGLQRYPAVTLFADRARLVLPGYELGPQNSGAVARICRLLDGIPLAIEMAAARIPVLAAEQLASRLDDTFRLLTGGSRAALPRQQTLRATVDWSYQLLTEPERALFRRLSVFHGGWTLEAAEAIAGDRAGDLEDAGNPLHNWQANRAAPSVSPTDVIDLLTQLVSKSLVVAERKTGDQVRYRMLEPIRQFAWQLVVEAGEADSLQTRHLDYFLSLAEQAEPKLYGATTADWLARLDSEHDNLRAALERSQAAGAGKDKDLRLAGVLYRFWLLRGHHFEGRRYLEAVLSRHDATERSLPRALALLAVAGLILEPPEIFRAFQQVKESVEILREIGPKGRPRLPYAMMALAERANNHGDGSSVQLQSPILFEESAALFRELADKWGLASALKGWANSLTAHLRVGYVRWAAKSSAARGAGLPAPAWDDLTTEWALLSESLALFRELGDRWAEAGPMMSLASVAFYSGDRAAGRAQLEECLAIYREFGDKGGIFICLERLGTAALGQDDWAEATERYEECVDICEEVEYRFLPIHPLNELGEIARRRGDFETSTNLINESLVWSKRFNLREDIANSLDALGRVAWSRGDLATARRLQVEAFALRREANHPISLLQSLQSFAILTAAEQKWGPAATLCGAVERFHHAIDYSRLPTWRTEGERSVVALRAQLGEALFAAASAEGRAMTLEQAVAYALEA
jgi:predicted ATPase/DNA-binding CsgD family transcriptional regulator